jgi:hypothetical protein
MFYFFYHNVMISLSGSKEGETTHVVKLYNHRLPLTVRSLVIITPVGCVSECNKDLNRLATFNWPLCGRTL